jgi:superfamily II DNA or RNA helicase
MTIELAFAPTTVGTEFKLLDNGVAQPVDSWAISAPRALLPAIDVLNRFVADDRALADGDFVLVEHAAIADLSAAEAAVLHLPPLSEAVARVATSGIVTHPNFTTTLQWRRATGNAIVGAERIGAWLRIGDRLGRLSSALFAIAEAVDAVGASGGDAAARLVAIGRLQELLPAATQDGSAAIGGLLPAIDVIQSDAFSLDLVGEGASMRLVPILHRAGETDPLLPPDLQAAFGDDQFNRFSSVRSVYTLPGNRLLVLAPALRRALGEVRRRQSGTAPAKRALMAAPRAVLRAALDIASDPTLIDSVEDVFVETPAYSDRVAGLGIWTPRVVPWIQRVGTDWFGPDAPAGRDAPGGLVIGTRTLDLDNEQAETLRMQVEDAIGRGEPAVVWAPEGEPPVVVPATADTRQALTQLVNQRMAMQPRAGEKPEASQATPAESLIILTNEGEVEYSQDFVPRSGPTTALPRMLATSPKSHQGQGIEWLQQCWLAGRPGVLLADDMGLGKTLQGLAFLAWLRESMDAGTIAKAPILIVAPTGLLANWLAEHDRHLRGDGLGECIQVYGPGLRSLLRSSTDGVPSLDQGRLRGADWVLTTYETLRDYDRDFGAVKFAVLLADEAQKVKTPGARVTDAIKGMNADFRIALTGTPVENRLADLWCIVDGVHSGWLGDLKGFSRRYEAGTDVGPLRDLKALLEGPFGGAPRLLLRRMKEDELPDLPRAEFHVHKVAMPAAQAAAYDALIANVMADDRKGAVLEGLQRLRSIALHPDLQMGGTDEEFIAASARLQVCFDALDRVAAAGERALIFLDSLDLQARLAGVIQRRYKLSMPPAIISGEVAGHRRQQHVDRFQAAAPRFDAMILSPRAGGVGLTLTRANHVIHLARWWNPAVEDQCTGRALRIGQDRTVHVHLPIGTLADGRRSFDQNLHDLLERKRLLMREALLPGGFDENDRSELLESTTSAAA